MNKTVKTNLWNMLGCLPDRYDLQTVNNEAFLLTSHLKGFQYVCDFLAANTQAVIPIFQELLSKYYKLQNKEHLS